MKRNFLKFLLAGLLVGCAENEASSYENLTIEVNSVVNKQMSLLKAQYELEKLTFQCMQGTSLDIDKKGIYECTRNRKGLLYSCIHRVLIDATTIDSTISKIQIQQPVCAGL